MAVQPMNESKVQFISHVLLVDATFTDYLIVCRRMNALIDPQKPGKKKTILALTEETHRVSKDVARSALNF